MNAIERYNKWLYFDPKTQAELLKIENTAEIEDRFYKELDFGTGGIRGLMGAGTNRVNTYTIRKISSGLVDYLKNIYGPTPSVVIAYDVRNQSRQFAEDAAGVFTAKGLDVFMFEEPTPTPVLSFAVEYLKASAGIVITASHNPKEYNGYKIYNHKGVQIVPREAQILNRFINFTYNVDFIPFLTMEESEESNGINWLDDEILEIFLEKVRKLSLYKGDVSITYTPLHGTGFLPIQKILKDFSVSLVSEQSYYDGSFPTVASPNPEKPEALEMAIAQAELEQSDLVLGTDPDCDRLGVAVKHEGTYQFLTGNQIGALLVDFVLANKVVSHRAMVIKTIVTNDLSTEITKKFGYSVFETLTGFKYIGEKITEFEKKGNYEFVIGFEESFGFLIGTTSHDKDAVVAAMLVSEMAAFYKNKNKTLIDRLQELYTEFGYYLDTQDSYTFGGNEGRKKIERIMEKARELGTELSQETEEVLDYQTRINGLPKANVLKFLLKDGSWFAIRPSGTEPKIKIYYSILSENEKLAQLKLAEIRECVTNLINETAVLV